MEVECDKVEIVSPSLLPQEYEMEYVQSFLTQGSHFWAVNGYRITGFHWKLSYKS